MQPMTIVVTKNKEHQLCLDHVIWEFKHKSVYPKNKFRQIPTQIHLSQRNCIAAQCNPTINLNSHHINNE